MRAEPVEALALRPVPLTEARLLLAGRPTEAMRQTWHPEYPLAETLSALALVIGAYQATAGALVQRPAWWVSQIVVDSWVVGDIGFHGPPGEQAPGRVEIGYCVVPAWRSQGVASRACALIVEQAWALGAAVIMADTESDNVASQRVLRRNGFRSAGGPTFRIDRP
jgi:RimJ/RimL family protein N-acetyltransferase